MTTTSFVVLAAAAWGLLLASFIHERIQRKRLEADFTAHVNAALLVGNPPKLRAVR